MKHMYTHTLKWTRSHVKRYQCNVLYSGTPFQEETGRQVKLARNICFGNFAFCENMEFCEGVIIECLVSCWKAVFQGNQMMSFGHEMGLFYNDVVGF